MNCDLTKGSNGIDRILFTLQPNVPQTVQWDFRGCLDGQGRPEPVSNFTVAVTKPRDKNLALRALKPGSVALVFSIEAAAKSKLRFPSNQFYMPLGTVTNELVTLQLTNTTSKPLEVEVTTSLIIGG